MNSNTRSKKLSINKALQLLAASLVALLGLQGCGSSGGGSTPAPAVPTLSVAAASVVEGTTGNTTTLDFTVSLDAAASSDVTVTYSTSDNTATATNPNADYTASSGATLVIPAGQVSGTINITVMGDTNLEFDEVFDLQISNAQNATISGGSQTVAGTILSDDSVAGYYVSDTNTTVNGSGGNLTINAGNIQVIGDINRLAIIDLTDNLIYIADISSYDSQTAFTANARIYKNGDYTGDNADINGAIITEQVNGQTNTYLELTLSRDATPANAKGNGDYTATLDAMGNNGGVMRLKYSAKNGHAPLVFLNNEFWQSVYTDLNFFSNSSARIDTTANVSGILSNCDANPVSLNNVVTEMTGRIRSFSSLTGNSCQDNPVVEKSVTGYITTFDTDPANGVAEDRILFIWFNSNGVHAAALAKF